MRSTLKPRGSMSHHAIGCEACHLERRWRLRPRRHLAPPSRHHQNSKGLTFPCRWRRARGSNWGSYDLNLSTSANPMERRYKRAKQCVCLLIHSPKSMSGRTRGVMGMKASCQMHRMLLILCVDTDQSSDRCGPTITSCTMVIIDRLLWILGGSHLLFFTFL